MERDEFLKKLGLGLALVCTGSCFQGCSKGGEEPEPTNNGGNNSGNTASIDITTLVTVGSAAKANGVLFIRVAPGSATTSFVATSAICPHMGSNLNWVQSENHIECENHHAKFQTSGAVKANPNNGDTVDTLQVYSTVLNGTTLTATKS